MQAMLQPCVSERAQLYPILTHCFGSCNLPLPAVFAAVSSTTRQPGSGGHDKTDKKGTKKAEELSLLFELQGFPFLLLLPELQGVSWTSVWVPILTSRFWAALNSGWGVSREREEKKKEALFQFSDIAILVFLPNPHADIYFSETSTNFRLFIQV